MTPDAPMAGTNPGHQTIPSTTTEPTTDTEAVGFDSTRERWGITGTALAIAEAVVALLDRDGGSVSFAEVDHHLDALGIEYQGEWGIGPNALTERNIYVWADVTQDYTLAINALNVAGVIVVRDTSMLVYLHDGKSLTLPLAKSARRYKDPHWAPGCIHRGPEWVAP